MTSSDLCVRPGCSNPRPPAPATGGTRSDYCSRSCRDKVNRDSKRPSTPLVLAVTAAVDRPAVAEWLPGPALMPDPPPGHQPGPCDTCGSPQLLTPRGTLAACPRCQHLTLPSQVLDSRAGQAGDRRADDVHAHMSGRVQHLLGQIKQTVTDGRLDDYTIGRLGYWAEELDDARKKRDPARVAELENRLAAEDLGYRQIEPDDLDDDIVEGEIVEDTGWQPAPSLAYPNHVAETLGLSVAAIEAPKQPAPHNPAQDYFDRVNGTQPQDEEPARPQPVRDISAWASPAAHVAAPQLQQTPVRNITSAYDPVSAAQAAGLTGADLVAVALRRQHPFLPPAGAPVRAPRRILPALPWSRRDRAA